jgi:hypothetical protein
VNEKKEKENIVEPIVEEKIESVIVTPTEVKEPIIEQKTEIKEDPSPAQNVPPLGPGIDIDALLDAKLKEYLKNNKGKVGRPRDYDEETTVISIRLEKRIYEFAKNQARVENTSMTQYIKELIRKEMDKG